MQNQHFADRRDFFKCDLLLEVMEKVPGLRQLTWVPMLTPNDGSGAGGLTEYEQGQRRKDLYDFLRRCLADGRRDLRELRGYFAGQPFLYTPYRDGELFTPGGRGRYFQDLPDSALRSALVFFDPDTGLEVPSMRPTAADRYLRYAELAAVFGRMADDSALLIYQHLPHKPRDLFFLELFGRLQDVLQATPAGSVSDNQIALIAVGRSAGLAGQLRQVLQGYAPRHGLQVLPVEEQALREHGDQVKCPECGLEYLPALFTDVLGHRKYHDEVVNGPVRPPARDDLTVWRDGPFRITAVNAHSSLTQRRRAECAAAVAGRDAHGAAAAYSATEPPDEREAHRFLLYSARRLIGLLVVEKRKPWRRCSWAQHERGEGQELADQNPIWTVGLVWVNRHHRRRGLALRLIAEAARHLGLGPQELGWSAPPPGPGRLLLRKVCPESFCMAEPGQDQGAPPAQEPRAE